MAIGKKTGGGSRKGRPNKTTKDVREAIALLAQRNVEKLENWLERTATEDPAKAASLLLQAIEYHIPKLGRAELTGLDGRDLFPERNLSDQDLITIMVRQLTHAGWRASDARDVARELVGLESPREVTNG